MEISIGLASLPLYFSGPEISELIEIKNLSEIRKKIRLEEFNKIIEFNKGIRIMHLSDNKVTILYIL